MERDLLHLIDNHKVIDIMWYDEKTPLPNAYVALFVPKTVHPIPKHIGLTILESALRPQDLPFEFPHYIVPEGRFLEAQKLLLDKFYPIDWNKKKIIGITGTNGKTTTCELGRQILEQLQIPSFSLGSLGLNIKDKITPINHNFTTPPPIDLHKLLHFAFKSCDIGFMEVSAHGIHQNRCFGIPFSVAGWTSFSQDHLDYFSSMDTYFQTKEFFVKEITDKNIPFVVSGHQKGLIHELKKYPLVITDGSIIDIHKKRPPFLHIPYNLENLDMAIECINCVLGEKVNNKIHFDQLKPASGRFNVLEFKGSSQNKTVIIDAAHTPDALENLLKATKMVYPHKNIHLVFGCGGDRDSKKRPIMGKIAQKYAQRIFLTNDNPRNEDPELIIDQIEKGMDIRPYFANTDRKKTIFKALSDFEHHHNVSHHNTHSKSNDFVLIIAGKGPEEYQIIKDQKIPFNDKIVVEEFFKSS